MTRSLQVLPEELRGSQVVVFTAPTGCGESTRIPRHLSKLYEGTGLKVACTQPRRIAATSLAKVVARDMGSTNVKNGTVSYKIRFDNTTNPATKLVFVTDGALLNELLRADDLAEYSAIVVDEAHERSMYTELLLCMLKSVLARRKSLKLVIMSATLNAKLFIDYLRGSELFEVENIEMFHFEILYSELPIQDVVIAAAHTVADIYLSEKEGHILVFLAGVDKIDRCYNNLFSAIDSLASTFENPITVPRFEVRKLHAKQPPKV